MQRRKEMAELFKKELEKNRDKITQVYSYADIQKNRGEGRISALLSLEEGAIFEKSSRHLQWLYDQGARIATLTWNHENDLAYPNRQGNPFKDHPWSWGEERGLKEKGIRALEQMESLGMIPDVSHLSDGGFWDVAKYYKKPFLATHSQCQRSCSRSCQKSHRCYDPCFGRAGRDSGTELLCQLCA